MIPQVFTFLTYAALLASATPITPNRRAVDELNEEATAEAHQRDNTATRALSDVQIKTSDGRCLFVDPLSGDFRANLTPIQIAECGGEGQGWDLITAGEHNDQPGTMLVVSTLTQACGNFDPRRAAGDQVNLFSCGGRAAGEGEVTNSQLFALDNGAVPSTLQPQNEQGKCFTANGNKVDIADCDPNDAAQTFTFGGATGAGNGNAAGGNTANNSTSNAAASDTVTTAVTNTRGGRRTGRN